MLWIPLTIAAAFLQNLRSLLQRRLTGALSVNGAAYVRFCFALPFAWLYLWALTGGAAPSAPGAGFWGYVIAGSLGQMFASACLMAAFTLRSFAVGTALSKTEAVQESMKIKLRGREQGEAKYKGSCWVGGATAQNLDLGAPRAPPSNTLTTPH